MLAELEYCDINYGSKKWSSEALKNRKSHTKSLLKLNVGSVMPVQWSFCWSTVYQDETNSS